MTVPESLAKIIRWVMRDVTYHKHYAATVQGQVGDDLDVVPDDPAMRGAGLSRVPIMYGLPGVSAQVLPGTRVTLYFEDGDPGKPRVHSWQGGHVSLSFADGVLPVARATDQIVGQVIIPAGSSAGTYPVTGQVVGGAPTVTA
jgi:hypothetical protein